MYLTLPPRGSRSEYGSSYNSCMFYCPKGLQKLYCYYHMFTLRLRLVNNKRVCIFLVVHFIIEKDYENYSVIRMFSLGLRFVNNKRLVTNVYVFWLYSFSFIVLGNIF